MSSPFEGIRFVLMWLGFLVLMSSGIAIFFLWAVRNGQFTDQDRARYLPLMSRIPSDKEERERLEEAGSAKEHGRRQL